MSPLQIASTAHIARVRHQGSAYSARPSGTTIGYLGVGPGYNKGMAGKDEFAYLDATAQAELVRRGEVTPLELVDAAIERIERVNPDLNAVVTPMYDIAREAASGELPNGPFTGVPFLLKDLMAGYAGTRLTFGSVFARDFVSAHDSELVARLKRAGLIVLGKTNTPEFGLLPTTESRLLGPCRNPWNPELTSGGSSGGSAAAVAAGLVPMAHASDGGGSIRIPASCCGLFGLKPTRARNPLGPGLGEVMGGLVVEHAVTRTVRDSAALLDATSGPDIGDPYWAPPPARPFKEEVGADPGRLRIAFTARPHGRDDIHPDCARAVLEAAELCAELGHEMEEASPEVDWEAVNPIFMAIWSAGCAWSVDGMAMSLKRRPAPDELEPMTWRLYEMGHELDAGRYLLSLTSMHMVSRRIARFFVDHDLWLTPTLGEPPLSLGTMVSKPDFPLYPMKRAETFVPITPICNLTGQPAMTVPLHWNADGLPIGVHFAARFGDEATLFRLAAQLEQARPWADRRPPLQAGAL